MGTTVFLKKIGGTEIIEPALTPPSLKVPPLPKPKLGPAKSKSKKRDIPEGLWTKCPKCSTMIFDKELDEKLKVCPKCTHHFPISARERIHSLVETCTFEEMDAEMSSVDILKFASYESKLERDRKATLLKDAVVTGMCKVGPHRVGLGVMEFGFMGGSMGAVVGEKLTRLIERSTEKGLPVIIISASGGARMQEGAFSLMQMAKTSGALAYHAQNRLPYISILTQSDYGGVMASYASLGDLILAEPGALIGFAGPRVIKDTTQAELPPGFQTAEFLLDHGLIDAIVARNEMKDQLIQYLDFMTAAKKAAVA
ncbi:MAG TPA: acetyl-CoA carboxylase, carboxyltransferase subunit beta [Verrucomicrobiae bacterium]|jgi:acetyl-CoA carboxylase carboxyl transferase subunit beta|nr:acetyl-CoA carboxylase, carboxyltransferase subunit beta [Verrucomicrobiae bacterium]